MSSTEPLVIIDGVPAGLGDFYALSSTDVESVSVLKECFFCSYLWIESIQWRFIGNDKEG